MSLLVPSVGVSKTQVNPHPLVAAKQAFEKQDLGSLNRAKSQLSDDPLLVWPSYWNARLIVSREPFGSLSKKVVAEFEGQFTHHPLVQTLKNDWLLAGVRARSWPELEKLLNQIPAHASEPAGAQCARARQSLSSETRAQALSLLQGRETSEGCLGLLDALSARKWLNQNDVLIRARWASLAGDSPATVRIWKSGLAQGIPQPKSEQVLLQILQLSRQKPTQAAELYARQHTVLSSEQRAFASLAIAARLWLRTDPRAWNYLSTGLPSAKDQPSDILESAARLALRRADRQMLAPIIAAMPQDLQRTETWAYWRGWIANEAGQAQQARLIWSEIPEGWSFYRLLASESLGKTLLPDQHTPPDRDLFFIEALKTSVGSNPFLHRSLTLSKLGMRSEAVVEWNALIQQLNDNGLIAASKIALAAGQPDRAIAAAIRTQHTHDFSLRYPKPFKDLIAQRAEEKGLSPGWVLGLIRQESRFLTEVKSPVGATGLMQLMPQTAKSVARSVGINRLEMRQLSEPSVNVHLGTTYLHDMQRKFEGSAVLASAAYNAGPSRSQLWRASLDRPVPGAAFAESIPFTETRDYVKQVLANTVMYEILLNRQSASDQHRSLTHWLSEITPRAPASGASSIARIGVHKER